MDLWKYKPVQQAAQSLALGSVLGLGLMAYKKIFKPKASIHFKIAEEFPEIAFKVQALHDLDPDALDLFARSLTFRRFYVTGYDAILDATIKASELRKKAYEQKVLSATNSAAMRQAYQEVIEKIRFFRAYLELKIESAVEDFDEVAVDFNSKIEQICQDAIQDTFVD